jgi:nuclear transport factor 2 (NTF2) superfamily protein
VSLAGGDRISVRFTYEWRDASGGWFRSCGNENWEFDAGGLTRAEKHKQKRPATG